MLTGRCIHTNKLTRQSETQLKESRLLAETERNRENDGHKRKGNTVSQENIPERIIIRTHRGGCFKTSRFLRPFIVSESTE